jgi:2,4-dienoyl-CoA reductase-like NADH-dependent reductase (Old Yellow Enzyme family)/thioredoxin reductase
MIISTILEREMHNYDKLLSPFTIGNLQIRNRTVMTAMCLGLGQFDGTPTNQLIDYYETRAKGGIGLIITEITRINDFTGLGHVAQLSLSNDSVIEPMKQLVDKVHAHGTKIFFQLHHPGYQNVNLLNGMGPIVITLNKLIPYFRHIFYAVTSYAQGLAQLGIGLASVAPSNVAPCDYVNSRNRALSSKEIEKLIQDFINGAIRAQKAGADGVEVHVAHGYLLNEFLSPRTNLRYDQYGGSFNNRMRCIQQIISGIRTACGEDFPISVRISADECYQLCGLEGKEHFGYDLQEGIKIAQALEQLQIDVLNVSLGTYETMNSMIEPVTYPAGWRTKYISQIRAAVKLPIIAVNMIRTPDQAMEYLNSDLMDFVGLGRPTLADPLWVIKTQRQCPEDIKRCISCLYCFESTLTNAYHGHSGECAVNPTMGHENTPLLINGAGRHIVVVGAGPAGLKTAEILAQRNFQVTILEQQTTLGGQVRIASLPTGKSPTYWCIEDLQTALTKLQVNIIFNHQATLNSIMAFNPYAVIIATGSTSIIPNIIGHKNPIVMTVEEVFNHQLPIKNQRIMVIGSGLTGLETAEYLISNNHITIIEMASKLAPSAYEQHRRDIIPKLKEAGAHFLTGHQLIAITDDMVEILDVTTKQTMQLNCDLVVMAVGMKPVNHLYQQLIDQSIKVYKVGDAHNIGKIADAMRSAYNTAKLIN